MEYISTLGRDVFRQMALKLPYQDLLTLIKAYPDKEEYLTENFWNKKGLSDLGNKAKDREEYVRLATYNRLVVEGSERYLSTNICLMRAGMLKDRQLIQYFLNGGADPTFAYYGIISNQDKEDIEDLIEFLEPYSKKEGYFYWLCHTKGLKDLEEYYKDHPFGESQYDSFYGVFGSPSWSTDGRPGATGEEGYIRGMLLRGRIDIPLNMYDAPPNVPVMSQAEMTLIDALYLRNLAPFSPDIDGVFELDPEDVRDLYLILEGGNITNENVSNVSKNIAESSEIYGMYIVIVWFGFILGATNRLEKLDLIKEGIKRNTTDYEDDEERVEENLEHFRIGIEWGLFSIDKGPIPISQRYETADSMIYEILIRGYRKQIREIFEITKDESTIEYMKDILRISGLTDTYP